MSKENQVGSLNGVPVAYDDIKIVGELGDIYDDQGYIHLTIEAEFVVFRPKAGEKLVGVVNKVAPSHIGCLVHGCFNASLPKPYKMLAEDWQNLGVKIGDDLEFDVTRLDSDAVGVFCIRGRLDFESIDSNSSKTPSGVTSLIVGDVNQNVSLTKKAKIKIINGDNMDNDTENALDISAMLNTDDSADVVPQHEKTKKKKKKRKQEDLTILESDSCGYLDDHKKAKKKKRKHSEDEDISEISQEPKAKKKRRN